MTVRDKVFQAAEQLAGKKAFDQITFAEVAEVAGVHWTAVRRHFGSRQAMRDWFKERQMTQNPELADTRSRVLEAAERVFATHGYMTSSLEKVAEYAGLSKGAVYWHFSSKQDLFLAILERNYEEQLRLLSRQIEHILASEDPINALAGWIESQLACLESGDDRSRLFLEFVMCSRDPDVRERLQKLHRQLIQDVGALLEEMQRKGYLANDVDPYSTALMIDGLFKGVLIEWIMDPNPAQLQMLVQTISKTLWQGLAATKK